MIRDITIGQYYPANSLLHRLDPRVKLVGTLVFIISLFIADSWLGYVLAAAFKPSFHYEKAFFNLVYITAWTTVI